jgi:hypothetical protein
MIGQRKTRGIIEESSANQSYRARLGAQDPEAKNRIGVAEVRFDQPNRHRAPHTRLQMSALQAGKCDRPGVREMPDQLAALGRRPRVSISPTRAAVNN